MAIQKQLRMRTMHLCIFAEILKSILVLSGSTRESCRREARAIFCNSVRG